MTGSRCSPGAAGRRCPGTRRCGRWWTGAGTCCRGRAGAGAQAGRLPRRGHAGGGRAGLRRRARCRRRRCCPRSSAWSTSRSWPWPTDGRRAAVPDAGDGPRLLAWSGWPKRARRTRCATAFAAYYLGLAETADPVLRTAGQQAWMRRLTAEQDNIHAALRWAIERRDADTALRFVRALGWYWLLRGQPGEAEALARRSSRSTPAADARRASPRPAVVCALTAAGCNWDIDAVRPPLADGPWPSWQRGCAGRPRAASAGGVAEPMLALYERDPGPGAGASFDRVLDLAGPVDAGGARLHAGAFYAMLGRLDRGQADCRAALAGFRAHRRPVGQALALVQPAEFAMLDGDYTGAIAALEEAAALGGELGAWGDIAHMAGKLAAVRLRMGDLAGALADMERAGASGPPAGRASRRPTCGSAWSRPSSPGCRVTWPRRPDLRTAGCPDGGQGLPDDLVVPGAGASTRQALAALRTGNRPAAAPGWPRRSDSPATARTWRLSRWWSTDGAPRPCCGRRHRPPGAERARGPARRRACDPGRLRPQQPGRPAGQGRRPRAAGRGGLRRRLPARPRTRATRRSRSRPARREASVTAPSPEPTRGPVPEPTEEPAGPPGFSPGPSAPPAEPGARGHRWPSPPSPPGSRAHR